MSAPSSAVSSQLRQRVARRSDSALRHRLSLVPRSVGAAPRMPFVALVALILAAGVTSLLMFNTHMQQGAFEITRLQTQAASLVAEQQDVAMQLEKTSSPQQLAVAANKLGMVEPSDMAFLDLATGRVLGVPTPATAQGSINVGAPQPVAKPAELSPTPVIVTVPAPSTSASTTPVSAATSSTSSTAKTNPATGASTQ